MGELPEPVCGDCIAFNAEHRDDQDRYRGRCRFRPELGTIPEDLRYCNEFSVRRDRAGEVSVPRPTRSRRPRSSPRGPIVKTPRASRPTLNDALAGDTSGEISMDRDGLKQVLKELLEAETMYGYPEMSPRWEGGTLVLKPSDSNNQPKEVPLETFFHKIVMVRDRLRVLEAKINGQKGMSDKEKVDMQTYISKCYGTLTTFNVLFEDSADQFKSK